MIFMKFLFVSIFRKSVENIQFHKDTTKITDIYDEERYIFMIISPSILSMKNVSDEICGENQNTRRFSENHNVYEIMGKIRSTAGQATDGKRAHAG